MARGYLLADDDYLAPAPMGGIYMVGNSVPTVFSSVGVFVKVLGTTQASTARGIISPLSNRLVYSVNTVTQYVQGGGGL